jgi:hypothetical protein
MTLRPRRFWLSAIAISFSGLLLWLGEVTYAQRYLYLLNEMLSFPAAIALAYLDPRASFYGYPRWFDKGLFLSLVGLWWYLVGVELDFCLLRKIATKGRILRFCWIAIAAGFQGVAIWVVCLFLIEAVRPRATEPFYLISSVPFFLIMLSWLQLAALRFWRARRLDDAGIPTKPPLSSVC